MPEAISAHLTLVSICCTCRSTNRPVGRDFPHFAIRAARGENAENTDVLPCRMKTWGLRIGDGPNTVLGSTVSNTELSEFFWARRVLGSELSEFLSAYCLCVPKRTHRVFPRTRASLPQNSVRLSEFSPPKQYSRNSIPPVS